MGCASSKHFSKTTTTDHSNMKLPCLTQPSPTIASDSSSLLSCCHQSVGSTSDEVTSNQHEEDVVLTTRFFRVRQTPPILVPQPRAPLPPPSIEIESEEISNSGGMNQSVLLS
eukprot:PhF_6_TR6244/c3_g6_i1/m.9437